MYGGENTPKVVAGDQTRPRSSEVEAFYATVVERTVPVLSSLQGGSGDGQAAGDTFRHVKLRWSVCERDRGIRARVSASRGGGGSTLPHKPFGFMRSPPGREWRALLPIGPVVPVPWRVERALGQIPLSSSGRRRTHQHHMPETSFHG